LSRAELAIPPHAYPSARRYASIFYALACFYHLHAQRGDVLYSGESIGLAGDAVLSLKEAVHAVLQCEAKRNSEYLATRGEREGRAHARPCPSLRLNRNDFENVARRLALDTGIALDESDTYCSLFVKLGEWLLSQLDANPGGVLTELGVVREAMDGIQLGKAPSRNGKSLYAQLQLLKLDKYEYGKTFLNLSIKGDVRFSAVWYAVVGLGWLSTYSLTAGDTIVMVSPLEEAIEAALLKGGGKELREIYDSLHWLPLAPIYANAPPGLHEPYALLLALCMPEEAVEAGVLGVRFKLTRVRVANRAFTVVDEVPVDLSKYAMFVTLVKESRMAQLRSTIESLLRCALRTYAGSYSKYCEDAWGDLGDMVSMSRALAELAIGVNVYRNAYKLARLSPPPEGGRPRNFRDPRVMRKLLWVASRLARGLVIEA